MTRRQIQIPGTERTDVPPALLEAGEKWLDLRREKRRIGDKAKEARAGVLMLMEMHKHLLFSLKDPETQEIMLLELDNEPKLRTKKSGDVDSEVGDGIPGGANIPVDQPAGMGGLIAEAQRAQQDAGVEETTEGDVTPPTDASVPKKPRKRAAKAKKNGKTAS